MVNYLKCARFVRYNFSGFEIYTTHDNFAIILDVKRRNAAIS